MIRTPTEIAETAASLRAASSRADAMLCGALGLGTINSALAYARAAQASAGRLCDQLEVLAARERHRARADALAGMLSDTANVEALIFQRQLEEANP